MRAFDFSKFYIILFFTELDELLQDLDEDVEGMQGTIYYLQQELKKSKEKIIDLNAKNQELRNLLNGIDLKDNDNEKKPKIEQSFGHEDESSNDSTCLILKVNPEEEYATMLNIDDVGIKKENNDNADFKNKRTAEDNFQKNVPSKKQKRIIASPDGKEKVKMEPNE